MKIKNISVKVYQLINARNSINSQLSNILVYGITKINKLQTTISHKFYNNHENTFEWFSRYDLIFYVFNALSKCTKIYSLQGDNLSLGNCMAFLKCEVYSETDDFSYFQDYFSIDLFCNFCFYLSQYSASFQIIASYKQPYNLKFPQKNIVPLKIRIKKLSFGMNFRSYFTLKNQYRMVKSEFTFYHSMVLTCYNTVFTKQFRKKASVLNLNHIGSTK